MASKLIRRGAHEVENDAEVSLREAFELLEPQLRPPFPLNIPTPAEYLNLNRAILYGILCESHFARIHIKHLHGKVTDGYSLFTDSLTKIVNELYEKLFESVKVQLIWVTSELVYVSAIGVDVLLVALLRQIRGGDFGEGNLWLCSELVSLFLAKWDTLLEEHPMVLTSALYAFLRLLADHYRLSHNNPKVEVLKRKEIDFCLRMLRNQFHLCLKIGRDLVRLLQDLVYIPEFGALWKDLLLNPRELKTDAFSDISQLYQSRTSSRYHLLRISPEIETKLRFLLTHVKLGSQKRHQVWFGMKFLSVPERETLLIDIVRFICCAHHPTNEIIQSAVIPRWAVIGWLLKSCRKNYVAANMKLALFYDWLFFDERVDNVMNIEPAVLLMVNSIPRYVDMTNTLLEFLFLLIDNYDVQRNDLITRGVSSAIGLLVRKGVIPSLDVLISCDAVAPFLKERLGRLLSGMRAGVAKEVQSLSFPCMSGLESPTLVQREMPSTCTSKEVQSLSFLRVSRVESPTPVQREMNLSTCTSKEVQSSSFPYTSGLVSPTPVQRETSLSTCTGKDHLEINKKYASVPSSNNPLSSCTTMNVTIESEVGQFRNLVQKLGETVKSSKPSSLQDLEKILVSYVNLDSERAASEFDFSPEALSRTIANAYERDGCRLFSPLGTPSNFQDCDDEIKSPTALINRMYIFSQLDSVQAMLIFWSRNGYPVGARLLSYAVRLAHEAHVGVYPLKVEVETNSVLGNESAMPLLTLHVNQYFCFMRNGTEGSPEPLHSSFKVDKDLVTKLIDAAFAAYTSFILCTWKVLHKESDISLSKLLLFDLVSCFEWDRKKLKFFLQCTYYYLSDLSIGNGDIMKLLVSQLNDEDVLVMQFEISMKRYSIFGKSPEIIFHLIKTSFEWDAVEQHKFWGLIRSELTTSKVQLEKVILEFFCGDVLDLNSKSLAVGGLSALCSCCAPTPELVGSIMLIPNNRFQDFAGAVLAAWAVSNASMLFDSLVKFLEKLESGNSFLSCSEGIMINESAFKWLLSYLEAGGIKGTDILSKFSGNTPDSKSLLSCDNNG